MSIIQFPGQIKPQAVAVEAPKTLQTRFNSMLDRINFPVEKHPAEITVEGKTIRIPGYSAIYRPDTGAVLAPVGEDYKIIPYADVINPLVDMMEEMGFDVSNLWLRNGGSSMVLKAQSSEKITINGDDHTPWIMVKNSYDRSVSLSLHFGLYRMICSNGVIVPAFEGGSVDLKIRHTKNAGLKLDEWHAAVSNLDWIQRYKNSVEKMNAEIPDHVAYQLLADVYGADKNQPRENRNVVKAFEAARFGQGQHVPMGQKITGWNLYNGITQVSRDYINSREDESKTVQAMTSNYARIEKAHALILNAVKAA